MKFNSDKMNNIISEYLTALKRLEELAALKEEQILTDPHKVASAKYHLIICIEAIIDICNHIIARNGFRVPEDYADTFKVMGEQGIFPADFISILTVMARFRNRLVHRYWDVNERQIFSILQENLSDLHRFVKELRSNVFLPGADENKNQ